ncbi:MAG: protein kinase domain-containing protein, partial [Roseimicrobium sp.]
MPEPIRFDRFELLIRPDGTPQMRGVAKLGLSYAARDTKNGELAVVRLPGAPGAVRPTARMQFLQEVQAMMRVSHVNLARVLAAGDSPAGAFCAMEYGDGPTLEECIETHGRAAWEDVFRLARQATSVLQALEAEGLVLRGLRPGSMLVCRSAHGPMLKFHDYGLPAANAALGDTAATMSLSIEAPAYASPEEFVGAASDTRSQLYSLGAIIWFCLAGRPPFDGTQFEVMYHHMNSEPPWSTLPPLPLPALDLLKSLLAKSQEARPASPGDVSNELKRILGHAASGHSTLMPVVKREVRDQAGYELIAETGGDSLGKVWQARDLVTGQLVALRLLAPELATKSGLALRIQRLAAHVRELAHPNWQRVWHCDQRGADV